MPSRSYTSFLLSDTPSPNDLPSLEVSMPSRSYTSFLLMYSFDRTDRSVFSVNALSVLYLISTVPLQKPRFYAVSRACFCRYLSEYSDSSCFSCMLTIWTYLTRYTHLWHWIKYSTKYSHCHPVFNIFQKLFISNFNYPLILLSFFSSYQHSHTNFHTVNLRIIENHMKFPFHLLYRFIKSFLLSFKLNDFLC